MGVTLPTVEHFLLIYSLRAGSIVMLFWSFFRSLLTIFFFVVVVLETFVKKTTAFGTLFVHVENSTTDDNVFQVYYCSVFMIIAESFLMVFCIYLAQGIYAANCHAIPQFMICKFVTWMTEVTCLFVLCLVHKLLIGWYLGIFLFVFLEFYGFVVVYSLHVEMCNDGCQTCKPECFGPGIATTCKPECFGPGIATTFLPE